MSEATTLRMHRMGAPGLPVSRLYLKTVVFNAAFDANYCPAEFPAVIDTGAQISVVPERVLAHFGIGNVLSGPDVPLIAFDGTRRAPAASFAAHFRLSGLIPTGRRATRTLLTSSNWSTPVLCAAVPMFASDESGKPIELVILGMDFLSRCSLNINGPQMVETLELHRDT